MKSFKTTIPNCRPNCQSLDVAIRLLGVVRKMRDTHERYQFLLPEHIAKEILSDCDNALMDAQVNLPD